MAQSFGCLTLGFGSGHDFMGGAGISPALDSALSEESA